MHETITVNGCPEYQARATAKVRAAQTTTLQPSRQSANHNDSERHGIKSQNLPCREHRVGSFLSEPERFIKYLMNHNEL